MKTSAKKAKKTRPKPPFPKQSAVGQPPGLESGLDPRPEYEAKDYLGSQKLKDKVALITGGDSGIGRAVAILFAREGAKVSITHLSEESSDAMETLKGIEKEGQEGLMTRVDVRQFDQCQKVVERTVEKFGALDVLVNNAAYQKHVSFADLSLEQWDKTFHVNIYGYFYMIKSALPHLREGASIINTTSVLGFRGSARLVDYSATKGAIIALTKSLAQALRSRSIRVNAVAPGPVWTPLNPAERSTQEVEQFGAQSLYGRPAQPEEISPAFVYLASDIVSSYVTGEVIRIFGEI